MTADITAAPADVPPITAPARIAIVDRLLGPGAEERLGEQLLIAAAEPDAGCTVEQMCHGIRIRLRAVDPDIPGRGAEAAKLDGFFLAARFAARARHREDDDPRLATATGEVHELLHQGRRLRSATDDVECAFGCLLCGQRCRTQECSACEADRQDHCHGPKMRRALEPNKNHSVDGRRTSAYNSQVLDDLLMIRVALAGPYSVLRQIGQGGGANVYLAKDTRHDRDVAIKVLHPDVAAAVGVKRFRREIRVAANMVHPGIVPVLDSGECETSDGKGRLWYSMPYVEGESLRQRLMRDYILPVDVAVAIARELADALDYSHARGVVHRDVKPDNILLQGNRPLLADFGIAYIFEPDAVQRLTKAGVLLGTPQYMSPEQAIGERNLDARTDVYSLAAVLYETLVGEPPFNAPTPQGIISRMSRERAAPITPSRPTAAMYEEAVLKALSRSPDDRFATAAEFGRALAPPGAPVIQIAEPTGDSRWMFIGLVVVIVIALAGWLLLSRA